MRIVNRILRASFVCVCVLLLYVIAIEKWEDKRNLLVDWSYAAATAAADVDIPQWSIDAASPVISIDSDDFALVFLFYLFYPPAPSDWSHGICHRLRRIHFFSFLFLFSF